MFRKDNFPKSLWQGIMTDFSWHDMIAGVLAVILTVGAMIIYAIRGDVPEFLIVADTGALTWVFRGAVAAPSIGMLGSRPRAPR